MADLLGSPPSYDAVVSGPQPSAPPPEEIGPPTHYQHAPDAAPGYLPPTQQSTSQPPNQSTSSSSSKLNQFVKSYTCYSIAHHLRKYIVPKSDRLDPELDVEAQFSRHAVHEAQSRISKGMRLQCITGWLWCFGVLQIIVYYLLPVGMLVTGIVGFDDCPLNSNTIVIYLLLGGSVVAMFVLMRTLPSLMTCFRNRNCLDTRRSSTFTACICVFEVVFYMIATANLVILILGTVWIFQDTSVPSCDRNVTTNCCKTFVYVASAFFNIFQYVLYAVTSVYVCLVACCVRNMDKVYGRR